MKSKQTPRFYNTGDNYFSSLINAAIKQTDQLYQLSSILGMEESDIVDWLKGTILNTGELYRFALQEGRLPTEKEISLFKQYQDWLLVKMYNTDEK